MERNGALGKTVAAILFLGLATACGAPAPPPESARSEAVLPEIELAGLDGAAIRLGDAKGRVVLVNFWATWCAPCREEIPDFNDLYAAYRDQGFEIVAISMDDEGEEVVRPFVDENGMRYPVAIGTDDVAEAFGGVVGFPTTFLVDRQGKVVDSWVGVIPRRILEEKLQALIAG
jgi:thiol-disulfide isomerase/thioredoxin